MNNSRFGFKEGDLETIVQVISTFKEIKQAVIFGSRAKGNYQTGSDVDIALWALSNNEAWLLPGVLNEETLLPYKFDILDYETLENQELKDHIDRVGVEIYKKSTV